MCSDNYSMMLVLCVGCSTPNRNKKARQIISCVSNNNERLTLWAFAVMLVERKVRVMDVCRYVVHPFFA